MLISAKDVTKTYTTEALSTTVLHGVSLDIEAGDFVAIMGPSGSGKSTFMHILGFLDTLSTGTYTFDGADVSSLTDDELAKMRNERVGFVFQSFNLLPRTSVIDNVGLPLIYAHKSDGTKAILKAIDDVGLTHRKDNLSNQLSGGEKQRVAIARAIVNNPDLIFADEPTGNLDSKSGNQILKILQDMNDAGRTIIMVTHEADTAAHAKRIVNIRDGKIVSNKKIAKQRRADAGDLVK